MRLILRVVIFQAILASLLFGCAGRFNLPWIWGLLAIHCAFLLFLGSRISPELLRERMHPADGPGPLRKDALLRRILLLSILAHLVIIGLDIRFGWSGDIPASLRAPALLVYASSLALIAGAMLSNPFFSSVVRLQNDRGQHVVSTGPYRLVRHPGYLALLGALVSESIALGSWWSLAPLVLALLTLVYRTRMEDRFLHGALQGYADYAATVRYRLIPALW